jgi:hypothetical protein
MRVTSANPTQLLVRAPAARGARNKGCYFWTPPHNDFVTFNIAFIIQLLKLAIREKNTSNMADVRR